MTRYPWIVVAVLCGCSGGPSAPENPNSVPNIQVSLTRARTDLGAIYVRGGFYDGATVGQTATFVVRPDNSIVCTFQIDPANAGRGALSSMTAHRLTIPGLFGALTAAVLPNVQPPNSEINNNFIVEARSVSGLTTTVTGAGDPRFDALRAVFQTYPSPCWGFG